MCPQILKLIIIHIFITDLKVVPLKDASKTNTSYFLTLAGVTSQILGWTKIHSPPSVYNRFYKVYLKKISGFSLLN